MQIRFENVSFTYDQSSNAPQMAIEDINLEINQGEYVCITGPTGSGKSTLIQHINGLLKPTQGRVLIDGQQLAYKGHGLQEIRKKVGLLFQFPEDQLFEETIERDICFGPKKLGIKHEEINSRLKKVMGHVGLPYEVYKDVSPMKISGGQKRRAALACTLITEPEILILDEPTAGLDPGGKNEILKLIKDLNHSGRTIIKITHDLEDIAQFATRVIIMHQGKIILDHKPQEAFTQIDILNSIRMSSTEPFYISKELKKRGWSMTSKIITWEELEKEIFSIWQKKKEKNKND
ncbi:energy-coupling factor transporter ATPase [Desulfitibacter alkalitolerans]|uniref:energy-coupling factor transporter ATPase n=1 Tax=Desulfitibacter alkalitolerans TaxID=264641 RepID=UPI000481FD09|nr:energy-coupling factor transporter ATPase [Desulfitibacter alkalitolerans]